MMANSVTYPHIKVKLSGIDGNAFSIMGAVTSAMKKGGCTPQQIEEYRKAAMSDTYDHLIYVSTQTVSIK
jgi:hypothetical protein